MKKEQLFNLWVPLLTGVALLVYIILRAALLPVTSDESNTCLTFSVTSVWEIVTYQDPIPNNHILNTLLIKLFTNVFGMHAFVARLPNILGFILYYCIIVIWLRKLSNNPLFIITGIVLFTCNPYLIDFFSLARGYALSISLMITSCFFAWRYLETFEIKQHVYSLVFAGLAVYTNFTILNFFAALLILLCIVAVQNYYRGNKRLFYISIKQMAVVTIMLALISYYPIYRMISTGQFVFWGTNGFYADTLLTLIQSSAYGHDYFHLNIHFFVNLYLYCIFMMSAFAVIQFRENKFQFAKNRYPFFVFLILLTAIVNILQYYIVKTPYLTTRTALFYYPLSMVGILFFLKFLQENFAAGWKIVSLVVIGMGAIHLSRSINMKNVHEWWYDANTFHVLAKLEEESKLTNQNVTVDARWVFYPSLNFHIQTDDHQDIELRSFHYDIDTNSTCTYYYVEATDYELLKNKYDVIKSYGGGSRLLLKKKTTQ